ncbi:MAG: hypothetical protein HY231_20165 [Acidobacteria bacterium]|nr:hypothetical protein [Acidobacteriota bacterium]
MAAPTAVPTVGFVCLLTLVFGLAALRHAAAQSSTLAIHNIQGSAPTSARVGQVVTTNGIADSERDGEFVQYQPVSFSDHQQRPGDRFDGRTNPLEQFLFEITETSKPLSGGRRPLLNDRGFSTPI